MGTTALETLTPLNQQIRLWELKPCHKSVFIWREVPSHEYGVMTDPSAIETATRRLAMALDALQAAVERRREADRGEEQLVTQLHALGSDRSRLASELDAAAAHAKQLETANREIARRLDIAIDSVRTVIEANDR
jgi:hypothetical protein